MPPAKLLSTGAKTGLSLLGFAMALGGCAGYAPQPLTDKVPQAAVPSTIDLSQPLDDKAIATIAVIANPDLIALRRRARVADAQAFAAGLLPDPTFSVGADKVLSGPDPLTNLAASLGLDLNALRTRHVVRRQAEATGRQVHLDLAWSEWQTAGQARLQAYRVLALQRLSPLAAESQAAEQSQLDHTLDAAGHGDVGGDQVEAARTAALDAADKATTTQRALATAQSELHRLMGLPPETPLALADASLPPVPPDAVSLFAIASRRRADLAALREGYQAEEAGLHKAVLDQFPALNLTINGNRDTSDNVTLGPAVDFTLPAWNRNRGGIAVERASRDALKAEYEARLFQTRADITAAVDDLKLLRRQYDKLQAELPAIEVQARSSAAAAKNGDLSQAADAATQQALRDKQMQRIQAEQEIGELTIALELLTGVPRQDWTS